MNIAKDILNSQTTKGSDTMNIMKDNPNSQTTKGSDTKKGIIPKTETKGVDFCEMKNNFYIIRSDFGCYMKTRSLNKGSGVSIFNLHLSCKDGDHYIGHENGYFYIIRGNEYRKVKDLTTDREGKMYKLHPNCQGGDHYFSANGKFYIIFKKRGIYRRTTDMTENWHPVEYKLHPDCSKGIYYWGHTHSLYFLRPGSDWGVQYCGSKDFSTDKFSVVYSAHSDVLNFLPGGLSVTKGPVFGIWENIKTMTNDSNTAVEWTKKINKKVGYNKKKMSEITHSWKIDASASIETGGLAKLIAQCQFSFSAEYGGSHVSTESESWNTMTEEEEELKFKLEPKQSVYLWQFKMGLGKDQVLFCRNIKINHDINPPTDNPLPQTQKKKNNEDDEKKITNDPKPPTEVLLPPAQHKKRITKCFR
ncbi:uncharacterized protein LOC125269595 [Megalobrama amblycephala]|uniref:uncharacterized protein LOC125269595 n=1 Tax=Megalobrama amblycephala TaxID=75352 RepID=UPI002014418F|nr:uncharacterized protein LOC125269595 [Megalobrama amblycephala]